MKNIFLILLVLITSISGISQSCLPDGIIFSTQHQIDSFQEDYPGCTEIEGDVEICGKAITNLHGLFMLDRISGDLEIRDNEILSNLIGLNNLTNIGGELTLYNNDSLFTLDGLNKLTNIEKDFVIAGAYWDPNNIISLEALEDLTTIGGVLNIHSCHSLTNLEGLENINPQSLDEIKIYNNLSLEFCEIESICNYLSSPTGAVNIYNNAPGCNSPTEVASACGITLGCLPYGNYYFFNQNDINSFQSNFPGCNSLSGNVMIRSLDISNLDGLNNITSVDGDLTIGNYAYGNYILSDISGLNNLTSIGGSLIMIYCDSLLDINGLNNLESIGNHLLISSNPLMNNITGFGNLKSVGGTMEISHNHYLTEIAGFSNLESIGNNLWINNNEYLVSVSSFSIIDSISEDLMIRSNDNLSNMSGFSNLSYVGKSFSIGDIANNNLSAFSNLSYVGENFIISTCNISDLSDFQNLSTIGEGITIYNNNSLLNINGLNSIDKLGGDLIIRKNEVLNCLSGLNNLDTVGGDLTILTNDSLVNIMDLEYLVSIGGELTIEDNDTLQNLSGLDNILPQSISNLIIKDNKLLQSCDVSSICNYLVNPNGYVTIFNNATGCNNPPEIAVSCNITMPCLPFGHYYFFKQSDIDNFSENYPSCTDLQGNVIINGYDITNLNGLFEITSVEDHLSISSCNNLTNLIGLENLYSVGKTFNIYYNNQLESTTGLVSLSLIGNSLSIKSNDNLVGISSFNQLFFIGRDLIIEGNDPLESIEAFTSLTNIGRHFSFIRNHMVTDFSEFSNLESIGGDIKISINNSLESLTGLDNIDPNSIEDLSISYNESLNDCDVESICAYLVSPSGDVNISNNRVGCSSILQILDACSVGTTEIVSDQIFTIYPNPAFNEFFITSNKDQNITQVNIYNSFGQKVLIKSSNTNNLDISELVHGIYIVEIMSSNQIYRNKLIIQ